MRVTCLQENLHRALGIAGRAVATKTTLPVLGNFRLQAQDDSLTISATNLELGIVYRIPARVDEPGTTTLQARILSDFVSSLSSGEIELYEDQGPTTILVKQGSTQAHVRGHDPDDFPPIIPSLPESSQLEVDPAVLSEAIEQVVFAAAHDDSRPVLAGVHVEVTGNRMHLAAADGFRMSLRSIELPENNFEDVSVIVPARTMTELIRVLADTEQPARLYVTPNEAQLIVSVPDVTFVTRLIDGTFPDLQQIIPAESAWSTRTVVSRDRLLDAARRASIFARSNNDVVKFAINPAVEDADIGRLTITATAADTGDNRDDVDAQIEGEEIEVAFNSRYLTDLLSVVKDHSVSLELQGSNAAGVFKPIDDVEFVHVIMPMVIGAS